MAWFRRRRRDVAKPGAGYKEAFTAIHERVDRYRLTQNPGLALDPTALTEAAALWRAAQPADPAHPTDTERQRLAAAHHLLGWFHTVRYTVLPAGDDWADLAQALLLLTPFVRSVPDTIPELFAPLIGASADPDPQFGIGVGLLQHAMRYQDPAALSVAIELLTHAVAATPVDHPDLAGRLNDLGFAHRVRFGQNGATADLDAAIEYGGQAVTTTSVGHADLAMFQNNLDIAHSIRFEGAGETATWDPAIERVDISLTFVVPGHPDPAGVAANLDAAIERALPMIDDAPADPGVRLSDLAYTYLRSFQHDGVAASLDAAIDMFVSALAATPSDGVDRAHRLADLGGAYQVRFERTGATADLDAEINMLTNAVAASSDTSSWRPRWLSMLCAAHRTRFELTGKGIDRDGVFGLADQARRLYAPPLLRAHRHPPTRRIRPVPCPTPLGGLGGRGLGWGGGGG